MGGGADRPVLQPAGRRRGRGGGRGGGGGGGGHGCGPVPPSRGGGGGGGVSLVPHTLTGDLLAGVLAGVQPAGNHTGRTTGLACNTQVHHRPLKIVSKISNKCSAQRDSWEMRFRTNASPSNE